MWESPLCLKAIAEYHRFFSKFRGVFIVMTQTMESGHPPIQTQKLTSFRKKKQDTKWFFQSFSGEWVWRNSEIGIRIHPPIRDAYPVFGTASLFPCCRAKKNRIFVFIDPTIWNSLFMHRFCRVVHHFIHYGCISYQLPLLPTIPHPPPDVRRPLKALATSALAAWTTSCIGLVSPHRNRSS